MTISIKSLFARPGIAASAGRADGEVISLHNSLANHDLAPNISLREAVRLLLQPADGDGYGRGCHGPTQNIAGELAYVVPSWVAAHDRETHIVEGLLTLSKITHTDFPLRPWHTYYDWNFYIQVDPQYTHLLSYSNIEDHEGTFECEWDTGFLPSWAWPQDGDRIWMVGRWIYDCGHPEEHGHKTEIHPPKAVASFRTEAVQFAGNKGPTRANNAVLYIGRNGGYWQQPINDQNYAFDLYLPPRPYPEAVPVWKVASMTGTFPVQPSIAPYPTGEPKVLRVVIPLKGVTPHLQEYGAIISAGWSDPRNTESASIQRVRIRVTKIYMDGDYDTSGDEWYVYIGVNGRWQVYKSMSGWERSLDFSVDLDLHPADKIKLTASGFEADILNDYMGDESGYSWSHISDPNLTQAQREAIEDHVFWQLSGSFNDENDRIGIFSVIHNATERGSFQGTSSSPSDYRLDYTIESR